MSTLSVYKNGVLLGTGDITNGGNITSYTGVAIPIGKNIQYQITSSTDSGKTMMLSRVTASADAGATLTTYPVNPWAT
jgi:hypothetical protein